MNNTISAIKNNSVTTANRMLRNCQEQIRFCYDRHGKSYDKYDPCYAAWGGPIELFLIPASAPRLV